MVYYIKLKAVLCWNQDPKVKVKNEADRVLVCQRKAHTHVLPDIWRRERRGGLRKEGTRVDSFMSQRENDGECFSSPFQSFCLHLFCCLIFSSPPLSTFYFLPPPSSFLHLSHFLVFPSSNPLLSIRLLPSSLSIVVSSSSHLPQPYFLHPIALSFSNPSFFPAVIRSVRTAATGWAPNKN